MKRPSFQFYPADWQANSNLRRCSFEEKGIWLEVICLLHDQERYGVSDWTLKDLAQAVGATPAKLKSLVDKGVLKGADTGKPVPALVYIPRSGRKAGPPVTLIAEQDGPLWYSSRMVEDEYKRVLRGELGGSPKAAPMPPLGEGLDAHQSTSFSAPDPSPFSCAQASRAAVSSSSSSSSTSLKPKSTPRAGALATRLPPDWLPTDGDAEYCKTKRPDLLLTDVAERFRDYWVGSGGKKVDWNATWRHWVQSERRITGQGAPPKVNEKFNFGHLDRSGDQRAADETIRRHNITVPEGDEEIEI